MPFLPPITCPPMTSSPLSSPSSRTVFNVLPLCIKVGRAFLPVLSPDSAMDRRERLSYFLSLCHGFRDTPGELQRALLRVGLYHHCIPRREIAAEQPQRKWIRNQTLDRAPHWPR